ncbi:hypothetical protein RHO14_07840 [Orbus wheelerorum]
MSSSKCGELRQDLDAAGKSYDGKLSPDDPYYHYLQSQYKDQYDGYKEINSLEFDLALKDVEAYREWKAQQLTKNYGFSIETSRNLVFWERVSNTAMAAAAAIVGPKVVQEATGTKPPVSSTEKGTSTTANKPNNIVGEAVGDVGKGVNGHVDKVIPNGNGNLPVVREGKVTYELSAKPNADELRAGNKFSELGYDVTFKKESTQSGVRTQDLWVNGVGKVDVYTPKITDQTKIIRAIEKKDTQTTAVLTQIDLSGKEMEQMAGRVWGKPNVKNINTLFFQDSKGQIHRFDRPVKGK